MKTGLGVDCTDRNKVRTKILANVDGSRFWKWDCTNIGALRRGFILNAINGGLVKPCCFLYRQCWEYAIKLCKGLAVQYEEQTFDFIQLSQILVRYTRFSVDRKQFENVAFR